MAFNGDFNSAGAGGAGGPVDKDAVMNKIRTEIAISQAQQLFKASVYREETLHSCMCLHTHKRPTYTHIDHTYTPKTLVHTHSVHSLTICT